MKCSKTTRGKFYSLTDHSQQARNLAWRGLLIALCFLAVGAVAYADEACCTITAIDASSGMVTARETETGDTFQFTPKPDVLKTLKVGQKVDTKLIRSAGSSLAEEGGVKERGAKMCSCGTWPGGSCKPCPPGPGPKKH